MTQLACWFVALTASLAGHVCASMQEIVSAEGVRIACLGDSITFGARIADREHHAYPAQLQALRRGSHSVRNFGVGGATLLRAADHPYSETQAFRDALAWQPDIAVLMLGTNDTCQNEKRTNWQHAAELERDVAWFVAQLRRANERARILLASPPGMFPSPTGAATAEESEEARDRRRDLLARAPRRDTLARRLREVAATLDRVEFIDLAEALTPELVSDGVHPTPLGAERIALRIDAALGLERPGVVPPASTRARPSAEYRGAAAGWGDGSWWDQLERLRSLAAQHPHVRLVFLGDSITQGLTGAVDRLAAPGGTRVFDRFQGSRRALSLGLSGDRTEHLLYRIEHGALARLEPRVVVLQIGVNNIVAAGHTGSETALGIEAVVAALRRTEPQAMVIIAGPFPAGATPDDPRRVEIDRVHDSIRALHDGEQVFYVDLRELFLDASGRPNECLAGDHIHITRAGQEAWMKALEAPLRTLLDG